MKALRIAVASSALLLCVLVVAVPGAPMGSVGRWGSDHASHYGAAILFWQRGLAVFDTPVRALCGPRTAAGAAFAFDEQVPEGYVCERSGGRPLVINWQAYPRPYPPGALIYAAPEALLYAHTSLSAYVVNRIAIVKDVIAGHLLVLVLLELLLATGPNARTWRRAGLVLVPLVYLSVVPFAAAGFYDPIAIACVCWAIGRLERDRPVEALALLSLGAFLHFRAIYYVPLGLVTLARLRGRGAELRSRRGLALVATSVVLLAAAALALVLVGPSLGSFPHTNPVLMTRFALTTARIDYLVLIALVLAVLALQRQWLLVVLVAWQALVIALTVQAQFWHPMFLLPLFAVAHWKRARMPVIVALVLLVVGVARIVYKTPPMIGAFVDDVITRNM